MKSHTKYSYLLHWICNNQRFKTHKNNGAYPLYLIINKVNRYFEEINENKHLSLVPINESKEKIKEHEELWGKIIDLIRAITKNANDYVEKYRKIKFNLDEELPLIEIHSMIIVASCVFHENNKYYPQVFLDECPYKL